MAEWRVSGPYVEACNCEAICPCRSVGGRNGSRATYQLCQFVIAWTINEGRFDELDLSGFSVVMAGYWDEDEKGTPWRVELYLDQRANPAQAKALADIFLGRAGGAPARNYAGEIREVLGVIEADLEVVHTPGRQKIRVGDTVHVRARGVHPSAEAVTCGIPGHDRAGDELVQELMQVNTSRLQFEFHGRCGFATTFDYAGDPALL
ncbi:MAG TPA: DUF1326 domain-containing protein [Candidatus Dormibacteraeota bacterium]|nr:DUF1326 domain-containing protein [Candidatus Dormibacteraeota bacterium]